MRFDGLRRAWQRTRRRRDLPIRLTFPDAAADVPPIRVVIFGEFADDWLPAFIDPALWAGIDGVAEVVRIADLSGIVLPAPAIEGSRTVIVPLSITNIRNCPPGEAALIPETEALNTLSDKGQFAEYMTAKGLGRFCPRVYASDEEAEFPCILKRTDLAAAWGIAVARSYPELVRLRRAVPFRDKPCIVQAFQPALVEYVTHCVCRDGCILWHGSFACEKRDAEQLRVSMDDQTITPVETPPQVLDTIGRVLAPLRFSGPCAVDYSLTEEGAMVIFEVNPRFGGTLTLPENAGRLRDALACIIHTALS
ncbi:MAG: hypothetical protein ACOY4R_13190 [Pseudomonadota bacterium]